MNTLLALVKFNDRVALVLKKPLKFTYEKHGDLLIGTDNLGVFVNIFLYRRPVGKWKAFGGREFDIPMKDGSVIKATGQWWDGGLSRAEEILGQEIVNVTAEDIESLKSCYVYCGIYAFKDKYEELIKGYKGEVYGYREFEKKCWKRISVTATFKNHPDIKMTSQSVKIRNKAFKLVGEN
ncbi:hypothetical protein [Pseudogracilibacillus auburnensis]|uniref:hypothetical protein n=1 Tax=Pseudogracilibacillus auburnensis TaxID=1494959 RepID=UPI001A95AD1B|nr:hypothetical protein [Pseudogracilibacillus auburnensis]MBO1003150.1 hypothetical protein [Pseudogracilibacillus auburnensis]